jgi:hypothetical protein
VHLDSAQGKDGAYSVRFYVDAGGLMSYSADLIEIYRRGGLRRQDLPGRAKPADLPVE